MIPLSVPPCSHWTGKGGYVALITDTDGKEFYSDESVKTEKALIYGTSFYKKALNGKKIPETR